jgi:hypothetical protein
MKKELHLRNICKHNTQEDEIEYKRKRAISKREVRKKHREKWNEFVLHLERDVTKPNPKFFKILKNYRQTQEKM